MCRSTSHLSGLGVSNRRVGGLELQWLAHLDQQNIGSGFGEGQSDGLANAAGAARDEGSVALEGEHAGNAECTYRHRVYVCTLLIADVAGLRAGFGLKDLRKEC